MVSHHAVAMVMRQGMVHVMGSLAPTWDDPDPAAITGETELTSVGSAVSLLGGGDAGAWTHGLLMGEAATHWHMRVEESLAHTTHPARGPPRSSEATPTHERAPPWSAGHARGTPPMGACG